MPSKSYRLAVGRIGDHVGPSKDLFFAVDTVLAEELLASRGTLVGKPVNVNHEDAYKVGIVTSVEDELDKGVLHCWAEISDPDLLKYLDRCKAANIDLETSPTFGVDIEIDPSGRRIQRNRQYVSLSILTAEVAGRGGPDVKLHYKRHSMDELLQGMMAIQASLDKLTNLIESSIQLEATEDDQSVNAQYEAGVKAGKEIAKLEYSLKAHCQAKGVTYKAGETIEEILTSNLPMLGVSCKDKSVDYLLAAASFLQSHSKPEQAPETKPLKISFKKSK